MTGGLTRDQVAATVYALAWVQQWIELLNPHGFRETIADIRTVLLQDAALLVSKLDKILAATAHLSHPSLDELRRVRETLPKSA